MTNDAAAGSPAGSIWDGVAGGTTDTARFVEAADTLLRRAVVAAGGGDTVRDDLVAGLRAVLALSGPYSVLRIGDEARVAAGGPQDVDVPPRRAFARTAARANEHVLALVEQSAGAGPATATWDHRTDTFTSSCVGYVWTPPVVARLLGAGGSHLARNYYNEWLWQLAALRDALVPFVEPSAVQFVVSEGGLRHLEQARDAVVLELTTRRLSYRTLASFVVTVVSGAEVARAADAVGSVYGAANSQVRALPVVLTDRDVHASPYLFDAVPAEDRPNDAGPAHGGDEHGGQRDGNRAFVAEPGPDDAVLWRADAHADGEEHGEADRGPAAADAVDVTEHPPAHASAAPVSHLRLTVSSGAERRSADLGVALRSHRYALRADSTPAESGGPAQVRAAPAALLDLPGTIAPAGQQVAVDTGGSWGLALLLLAKIAAGHSALSTGGSVAGLGASTGLPDDALVVLDVRPPAAG